MSRFNSLIENMLVIHGKALAADSSFQMSLDLVFPKNRKDHELYESFVQFYRVSFIYIINYILMDIIMLHYLLRIKIVWKSRIQQCPGYPKV